MALPYSGRVRPTLHIVQPIGTTTTAVKVEVRIIGAIDEFSHHWRGPGLFVVFLKMPLSLFTLKNAPGRTFDRRVPKDMYLKTKTHVVFPRHTN